MAEQSAETEDGVQEGQGCGDWGNQARLQELALKAAQPLPNKSLFERGLGRELGWVKVMLGGDEVAQALDAQGAQAAAIDDTILFRDPQPVLEQIGHELVHVQQQNPEGGVEETPLGGDAPTDPEAEAVELGQRLARGQRVTVAGRAAAGVPQFDKPGGAGFHELREQHEGRGLDIPAFAVGDQQAVFVDQDGQAPVIKHDHGHLGDGAGGIDESKRRDPSWGDRLALMMWIAKLEAAEILRPDLVDGTSAYRHFLQGGGAPRTIDYERFMEGDSSGAVVQASLLEDAQRGATSRHDQMLEGAPLPTGSTQFQMRTGVIPVAKSGRYPGPATENWQKAIGEHKLWAEMDVSVQTLELSGMDSPGLWAGDSDTCSGDGEAPEQFVRFFHVDLLVHMEDRYNFNPGSVDVVTGIPDSANGRFELSGLGQEYLNTASFTRGLDFEATMDPAPPLNSLTPLPSAQSSAPQAEGGRTEDARHANPFVR